MRLNLSLVLLAITLLAVIIYEVSYYQTSSHITVKVTGKERVTDRGSEDSRYLIFTEGETLECTDLLFAGKFNSSDIYGKIKENKTYTFRVLGWRNGFFSMYRNIVNITEEK